MTKPKIKDDGETLALLHVNDALSAPQSIPLQTGSYALSIFLMALHLTANAKLITETGKNGAAAASIVSTVQTIILGTATGMVLGTGIEIGKLMGQRKYINAGSMSRASWALATSLGLLCTLLFGTSRYTLPLIFDQKAALEAAHFFEGYAVGTLPTMFLMTSPQISFQAGDWWVPASAAALDYFPAFVLSYCFSHKLELGAFGVGLGGGLAAWLAAIPVQFRFLSQKYKPLRIYQAAENNLWDNYKKLSATGAKLALQRLTEWGNLFALTLIIGHWGKSNLEAVNASLSSLVVFNLFSQGIAHALGMLTRRNRSKIKDSAQSTDNIQAVIQDNKKTILFGSLTGMVINSFFAAMIILIRHDLAKFFLSENPSDELISKTEDLLIINGLSLIPDSQRIIVMGSERGWDDIMWPTLMSLFIMTMLGASIGYGAGEAFDESVNAIFITRVIAIFLTVLVVTFRQVGQFTQDKVEYLQDSSPGCLSRIGSWFMFFSGRENNSDSENSDNMNVNSLTSSKV